MDLIQKAKEEGLHIRNYSFGQHKEICPKCSHTRKKKSDMPLSLNIGTDSITWTCHHCNWQGGFNDKVNNVTSFQKSIPPKDIDILFLEIVPNTYFSTMAPQAEPLC